MPAWTEEERALVAPFVTNLHRDVYCVRDLPPEVTAVLFAYVSRSPLTFRANLRKLLAGGDLAGVSPRLAVGTDGETDDFRRAARRARKFHEKWVVGYGHASVAEHADLKFAIDSLSIVASKVLEDNRLAAYTEKSTRYQLFDRDAYVAPPELAGTPEGRLVDDTCAELLELYVGLQEPVRAWVEERFPRDPDVRETAWQRSVDAKVCDVVRYVLPAATRTAIGVSLNARAAAHAIDKLLSHPLEECRRLGAAMRDEAVKVCPSLLRYAGENDYFRDTPLAMRAEAETLLEGIPRNARQENGVELLHHDPDGEERILATLLAEAGGAALPYAAMLDRVRALDGKERARLLGEYVRRRGDHDWPLRALEAASYTMEMVLDYGAFRDVQRHRIATQVGPLLDASLGWETPPELVDAGLVERYDRAMRSAAAAHERVRRVNPDAAQYVLPMAFRKRVLFQWNLRELEHFVRLRSSRQGHRSYRKIAWQVADAVAAVHPRLAALLTVDREEYDLERLAAEERAERKRERRS